MNGLTKRALSSRAFGTESLLKIARGPRSEDREHTARRRLTRQLLTDDGRRIPYFVHGPLQVFLCDAKMLEPVLQLRAIEQIDLAAVGLQLVCQVGHPSLSDA
jgi:hypothetical protein